MSKTVERAPRRTPKQIAQDNVATASAKVAALVERAQYLRDESARVDQRLAAAEKKLSYLKTDPDLHDPAQMSIDDALDGGED